jgi:hypothetical protein
MRMLRFFLAAGLVATPLVFFAACGLDESGAEPLDGSLSDVSPPDAQGSDVHDAAAVDTYVPPTCSTIDASCLGIDVPDGWALFDLSDASTTCPGESEDFEAHPLITNAQLRSDSCTCSSCNTLGTWSCGNVGIIGGTGGSCNDQDASFASAPQCVTLAESSGLGCLFAQSATVAVMQTAATGSPTCNTTSTGTGLATTVSALGCRPAQCTTDYCGATVLGFQTCIVHNGDPSGVCPSGFHPAFGGTNAVATAPGDVTVSCGACTCSITNTAVPCTGTVRVFGSQNGAPCDGDGGTNGTDYVETLDAGSQCQNTGICSYSSLYYVPNGQPTPTCSAPASTPGDASLTNAVTICCAP